PEAWTEIVATLTCAQEGVDVRFGSEADICSAIGHVRFTPKSGHGSRQILCVSARELVVTKFSQRKAWPGSRLPSGTKTPCSPPTCLISLPLGIAVHQN